MNLPQPTKDAIDHSEILKNKISAEIQEKGPISFERFMHMALYYPGFGYYSSGNCKFGAAGDFVTAPEISPLFSWCVAKQCQQVLKVIPGASILELGAGTGVMALEILRELERLNSLPQRYAILEVSADLKFRQQQLFATAAPKYLNLIEWLDKLPTQPIKGIVLANEVIDAMPVRRFIFKDNLQELKVGFASENFVWERDDPDEKLKIAVENLNENFSAGYTSEINLMLNPWIKSLASCLSQGVMLFIDYGYVRREYFHPQRSMGTLMCHYRHHAHSDPFKFVGIQDITSHVDFTAVAEAGVLSDMEVGGFVHQAAFLMNCGIMNYAENKDSLIAQYEIAQQIKRLMLPGEMGEKFKALALTKNFTENLLAFSELDQTHKL